jgi:hypothetical protein
MSTPKKARRSGENGEEAEKELYVICNGLPGAMGKEVSIACFKRGLKVADFALTGPNMPETVDVEVSRKTVVIEVRFKLLLSERTC